MRDKILVSNSEQHYGGCGAAGGGWTGDGDHIWQLLRQMVRWPPVSTYRLTILHPTLHSSTSASPH